MACIKGSHKETCWCSSQCLCLFTSCTMSVLRCTGTVWLLSILELKGRMVALRLLQRRLSPIPSLKKWQDMCRLTVLRSCSQHTNDNKNNRHQINILDKLYDVDSMTNVNPNIKAKISRRLHNQQYHPLCLLRQRIQDFFYRNHLRRNGNPIFAVFDNLSPVVSLKQNFDDLLVPEDHPSRHPKVSSKASFITYTV